MTITAYKFANDRLPADFEHSCTLPDRIVVLPTKSVAVYVHEADEEYPDLATLLDHHDGAQLEWYDENERVADAWRLEHAAE